MPTRRLWLDSVFILLIAIAVALLLIFSRAWHTAVPAGGNSSPDGADIFFNQTFGNETMWTEIMGLPQGVITFPESGGGTGSVTVAEALTAAVEALGGAPTSNLKVALPPGAAIDDGAVVLNPSDQTVMFPTGLDVDVEPGNALPIVGVRLQPDGRIGTSCALCHSSVAPRLNEQQVQNTPLIGPQNKDLQVGVILALAQNSSVWFANVGVNPANFDNNGDGAPDDAKAFEIAVDQALMKQPPGFFDPTFDLTNNPTQIQDNFAQGDAPWNWDGVFFNPAQRALADRNNFVWTIEMDPSSQVYLTQQGPFPLLPISTDAYLTTILQNSPSDDARRAELRADILGTLTGGDSSVMGILSRARAEPGASALTGTQPTDALLGLTGVRAGLTEDELQAVSDVSSIQTIPANNSAEMQTAQSDGLVTRGQQAFSSAGCISCHSGVAGNANKIIPVGEIGTESSRAAATAAIAQAVGLPSGYETQGLHFAYATAPYLHDGGVAMGLKADCPQPHETIQQKLALPDSCLLFGVANTLGAGVQPDATLSLWALINPDVRQKVKAANSSAGLPSGLHITGQGHELGFGLSNDNQAALIAFVESLSGQAVEQAAPTSPAPAGLPSTGSNPADGGYGLPAAAIAASGALALVLATAVLVRVTRRRAGPR